MEPSWLQKGGRCWLVYLTTQNQPRAAYLETSNSTNHKLSDERSVSANEYQESYPGG